MQIFLCKNMFTKIKSEIEPGSTDYIFFYLGFTEMAPGGASRQQTFGLICVFIYNSISRHVGLRKFTDYFLFIIYTSNIFPKKYCSYLAFT